MAILEKVGKVLTGSWYSPGLAIALFTVLIIIIFWIMGTYSGAWYTLAWTGGAVALGYVIVGGLVDKYSMSKLSTGSLLEEASSLIV